MFKLLETGSNPLARRDLGTVFRGLVSLVSPEADLQRNQAQVDLLVTKAFTDTVPGQNRIPVNELLRWAEFSPYLMQVRGHFGHCTVPGAFVLAFNWNVFVSCAFDDLSFPVAV